MAIELRRSLGALKYIRVRACVTPTGSSVVHYLCQATHCAYVRRVHAVCWGPLSTLPTPLSRSRNPTVQHRHRRNTRLRTCCCCCCCVGLVWCFSLCEPRRRSASVASRRASAAAAAAASLHLPPSTLIISMHHDISIIMPCMPSLIICYPSRHTRSTSQQKQGGAACLRETWRWSSMIYTRTV